MFPVLCGAFGGVWIAEKPDQGVKPTEFQSYMVSPNPFVSFTAFVGHEAELFNIYNISGRLVDKYKGNRIGADLLPGVYFIVSKTTYTNAEPIRIVKVK